MKILMIGEFHQEVEKLLNEQNEVQKISNEEFIQTEKFSDIEVVVLRTFTTLKEKELEKLPKLKYVISCSVGMDNLDLEMLKSNNVELIHCSGTNANSVAEHTLYLILTTLRKAQPITELKNKTIGIIGLGNIGKLVAEKLMGFKVKIIAFDILEQEPEVLQKLNVEIKSFDEIIKEAEIITIHVPLNKHTKKLINQAVFTKMKENTFLINTARKEIIDEQALIKNQNKFLGIALDVYSENLPQELAIKNLVTTNHIAAQGKDSFKQMCLSPIKKFLEKVNENKN